MNTLFGWSSWCTMGSCKQPGRSLHSPLHDVCNEREVKEVAMAMVDNGLLAAGYTLIALDDCWQWPRRNATDDSLRHDPGRFPAGMTALAEWLHQRGFSLSLYLSAGYETCYNAGHATPIVGSFNHYDQDAETLAQWQVDAIKFDWCFAYVDGDKFLRPGEFIFKSKDKEEAEEVEEEEEEEEEERKEEEEEKEENLALARVAKRASKFKKVEMDQEQLSRSFISSVKRSSRPHMHVLMHCKHKRVQEWCFELADSVRVARDHYDNYKSTRFYIEQVLAHRRITNRYVTPNHVIDADFLMTGGAGADSYEPGARLPGQSMFAYRSEFASRVITSSNIIVSSDVRMIAPIQKSLLLNRDALLINRVWAGDAGGALARLRCSNLRAEPVTSITTAFSKTAAAKMVAGSDGAARRTRRHHNGDSTALHVFVKRLWRDAPLYAIAFINTLEDDSCSTSFSFETLLHVDELVANVSDASDLVILDPNPSASSAPPSNAAARIRNVWIHDNVPVQKRQLHIHVDAQDTALFVMLVGASDKELQMSSDALRSARRSSRGALTLEFIDKFLSSHSVPHALDERKGLLGDKDDDADRLVDDDEDDEDEDVLAQTAQYSVHQGELASSTTLYAWFGFFTLIACLYATRNAWQSLKDQRRND